MSSVAFFRIHQHSRHFPGAEPSLAEAATLVAESSEQQDDEEQRKPSKTSSSSSSSSSDGELLCIKTEEKGEVAFVGFFPRARDV